MNNGEKLSCIFIQHLFHWSNGLVKNHVVCHLFPEGKKYKGRWACSFCTGILFQRRLTWLCWLLLVKPFCLRGLMAMRCRAAEVSRQPRGLAGMVKSMGRELLPREPAAPGAAEAEGLMGLEESPEGICKTQTCHCMFCPHSHSSETSFLC